MTYALIFAFFIGPEFHTFEIDNNLSVGDYHAGADYLITEAEARNGTMICIEEIRT